MATTRAKRATRARALPTNEEDTSNSNAEAESGMIGAASRPKRSHKQDESKLLTKKAKKEAGASPVKQEDVHVPKPSARRAKKEATEKKPLAKGHLKSEEENASKKSGHHQRITQRDALPKLWNADDAENSYTIKIVSWNVNGIRALIRNKPNALSDLVKEHKVDVLCLQETKLQEEHLEDPKLKLKGHLLEAEGYDAYYCCSTVKKGYSGTAVFVKRSGSSKRKTIGSYFGATKREATKSDSQEACSAFLKPQEVSYEIGKAEHDAEGRIITLAFPVFTLTNVYVPNSGQKLERLKYRTESWDKDFLRFMQSQEKDRGLPVLWAGDLNVAHKALDVWNHGAKHLEKQSATTPEEKASFQEQLDAGFVDAFRYMHPEAKGQYSYWSQRAGNRPPNKGLRLDYFICSQSMFDGDAPVVVRDSYILHEEGGSDHCPVVLELEIKTK